MNADEIARSSARDLSATKQRPRFFIFRKNTAVAAWIEYLQPKAVLPPAFGMLSDLKRVE